MPVDGSGGTVQCSVQSMAFTVKALTPCHSNILLKGGQLQQYIIDGFYLKE